MATHASALKAHRQSVRRRELNRQLRTRLRSVLKAARAAIADKDLETAKSRLPSTVSLIDKMARKGIIHLNAAARYKSRLSTQIERASRSA